MAHLVDDLDARVTCRHCGRDWPAHMHSCPQCLAELSPDPETRTERVLQAMAAGRRVGRPHGVAPFAAGPSCTLGRSSARSSLRYTATAGWTEAVVRSPGRAAVAPLECHDVGGDLLFRMVNYEAAPDALVAVAADGDPLATFIERDGGIDVRDSTSAPVARLRSGRGGWALVETGYGQVAELHRTDEDLGEEHVDDTWALRAGPALHLELLAAVALPLAAKVLLGRARPAAKPRPEPGELRFGFRVGD